MFRHFEQIDGFEYRLDTDPARTAGRWARCGGIHHCDRVWRQYKAARRCDIWTADIRKTMVIFKLSAMHTTNMFSNIAICTISHTALILNARCHCLNCEFATATVQQAGVDGSEAHIRVLGCKQVLRGASRHAARRECGAVVAVCDSRTRRVALEQTKLTYLQHELS